MNKKLLIAAPAVLIVLIVFLALAIKNARPVLHSQSSKDVSQADLVSQGKDLEAKGDLLAARDIYQKLISDFPASADVMNWQKKSEDMNIKLLFSPTVTSRSIPYEIKPADTLAKIAKEYKTTVELIMKSNNMPDAKIIPGRKIKVWNAPFSIVVDKSQNTLMLKSDEEIIKTYIVSTGKNNSTPTGNFKITNKLVNPTWFKAGAVFPPDSPQNILGARWLGFDLAGYGIHGTIDPESLGSQVTQGCVRMSNSDVEELYTIVPVGTEVAIVD